MHHVLLHVYSFLYYLLKCLLPTIINYLLFIITVSVHIITTSSDLLQEILRYVWKHLMSHTLQKSILPHKLPLPQFRTIFLRQLLIISRLIQLHYQPILRDETRHSRSMLHLLILALVVIIRLRVDT